MSSGIRKPGSAQKAGRTAPQKPAESAPSRERNTHNVTAGTVRRPQSAQTRVQTGRVQAGRVPAGKMSGRKTDNAARAQKMKKMHKRYKVPLMILFVIFLVMVIFMSSFVSYTYLIDRYSNPISADTIYLDPYTSVKFRIDKGMTTKEIADQLYDLGLIQNKTVYRFLSKFNGYDGQYKVGTYTLSDDLSYDEIMTLLAADPETVRVTFPEGFTTEQIAARLEVNNVVTAEEFLEALETVDVSSYPFLNDALNNNNGRDHRLDGYLFPDTYEFDVKANVEDVIYKMLNRFNELYLPSYYEKAEEIGLTVDEVVNLASLVEREAKLQSDRPLIAGVFINRLNCDDPSLKKLQSCATIRYVYKKLYNEDVVNITEEHERVDDPYNTYKIDGLTPGPICSPGIESIKAVLNYTRSNYYFFVLNAKDGIGKHIFSETYQEHLEAKNLYG